jgi:hypothetical protein
VHLSHTGPTPAAAAAAAAAEAEATAKAEAKAVAVSTQHMTQSDQRCCHSEAEKAANAMQANFHANYSYITPSLTQ